jgi:hypothetical protein
MTGSVDPETFKLYSLNRLTVSVRVLFTTILYLTLAFLIVSAGKYPKKLVISRRVRS